MEDLPRDVVALPDGQKYDSTGDILGSGNATQGNSDYPLLDLLRSPRHQRRIDRSRGHRVYRNSVQRLSKPKLYLHLQGIDPIFSLSPFPPGGLQSDVDSPGQEAAMLPYPASLQI